MGNQTRIRAVGLIALGVLVVLTMSGIVCWQAGSADVSNPRGDFWRVVRQGVPAYTSTPDQGHTILIQNAGENWREVRNGLITPFSQWILAIAFAALLLFYLFIGGEKLKKPRSGIMIERYSLPERILHWYTAVLFIIMGLTGLNLLLGRLFLLPVFGHPFVSGYIGASKILHNYSGPLLLAGFFLEFVAWARYNIPRKSDLAWFKNLGGLVGKNESPRSHIEKVNPGQKAWFWLVITFGTVVGITGVILDFPVWGQTRFTMAVSHVIHATVGLFFVAASLGHMYMGSIGSEGVFEGIWKGSVDAVWAEQHADLWYAEKLREKEKLAT